MRRIDSISTRFDQAVGFSNGCAEFTLKKPPPFVPSCLIAICEAAGPSPKSCFAPSSVVTSLYEWKFWMTPCETRKIATMSAQRQEDVEHAPDEVDPEVAERASPNGARGRG